MGSITINGTSGSAHAQDLEEIADAFGKVLEAYGFNGSFIGNTTPEGATISGSFGKAGPAGRMAAETTGVQAKFRVGSIGLHPHGGWDSEPRVIARKVEMHGVQGEPFGKATPSASCNMLIVNPAAAAYFEPDAEYVATFTKVKPGIAVTVTL